MAELVDALVSKTSEVTLVPVRSRLRVQKKTVERLSFFYIKPGTYYVYVIKSLRQNWIYVGMTEDIERRLEQHNRGWNVSTKSHAPFRLIFSETYSDNLGARKREKYLKSAAGKRFIRKYIESIGEE